MLQYLFLRCKTWTGAANLVAVESANRTCGIFQLAEFGKETSSAVQPIDFLEQSQNLGEAHIVHDILS